MDSPRASQFVINCFFVRTRFRPAGCSRSLPARSAEMVRTVVGNVAQSRSSRRDLLLDLLAQGPVSDVEIMPRLDVDPELR